MNIKGQGHSLTLVQGHSDSTFLYFFSLGTLGQLKPNVMWNGKVKFGPLYLSCMGKGKTVDSTEPNLRLSLNVYRKHNESVSKVSSVGASYASNPSQRHI